MVGLEALQKDGCDVPRRALLPPWPGQDASRVASRRLLHLRLASLLAALARSSQ